MAKLYLFCLGGTGTRVLRSLTMVLSAGVKVAIDEIVPIIIDSDLSNGDLIRTVSLLKDYTQIRSKLTFEEYNNNTFFKTRVRELLNDYMLVTNGNHRNSHRYLEFESMSKANQAMTQMLFSSKNLDLSHDSGFKGYTNIGSVMLNQLTNSPDFVSIEKSFEPGDKIFIISSTFGGTGVCGFPLLLETLRDNNENPNHELLSKAKIGSIMILPYFALQTTIESEIDSCSFISKTNSALEYYENISFFKHHIDVLYYLGSDYKITYEHNECGVNQKNLAHIVEFFAASAIVDFCNNGYESDITIHKELGIRKATETVTFSELYDGLTEMMRLPLTQFMLLANCFGNKFDTVKSSIILANLRFGLNSEFYNSPFVNVIKKFLEDYKNWLKELQANTPSLCLFDLWDTNKPFDIIKGVKPLSVFSIFSNYNLFFERVNSAASKCNSKNKEDRLLELYSLATKRLAKEKFNF